MNAIMTAIGADPAEQRASKNTSLLIHDYSGHAFTSQLARNMARLGHRTNYISFAEFSTPKGRVAGGEVDPPGYEARQISIGQAFDKENLINRARQQVMYARRAAEQVIALEPKVVISGNAPLEVQDHVLRAARKVGAKFIFWIQDINAEAIGRILGRKNALLGHFAGAYYRRMERRLLHSSDSVIAIAEEFRGVIGTSGWGGVPDHRIDVIENWAPLEDIPIHPRDNDWAVHNYRPGRRRIVYSGTLARKHNPEILVKLAQRVDADIHLFSAGSGADHVKARAAELGLPNLFVRPWVTVDELPKMLAGADVLCAFIEADAGIFSVPSKVLSYLAAGRPILASIPHENLATRTILKSEAGLVSEPGDDEAMLRNAEALLVAPELRERLGRNGRAHAEREFDIERIAAKFERIVRARLQ